MPTHRPFVRFDDIPGGTSRQFSSFREEITARTPDEVRPALRAVQDRVDAGRWAAGLITYEAASGLDPALATQTPSEGLPLLWFGIADAPDVPDPLGTSGAPSSERGGYEVGPWADEWTPAEHAAAMATVQAAIAAGETYQTNLTTRRRGHITGDLLSCYLDLIAAQEAPYGAYLDLGRTTVLSASPELFISRSADLLTTAPMKGTAARQPGPAADAASRAHLLSSAKERAENIMIVDLLRNDLARLARPGGVAVPSLLDVERYPTVWQMTSTITAEAAPGVGLEETMAAMFPCGSITGAPKASTMALIRDLETGPRGVYCGAIGWLAPARSTSTGPVPASSSFSVAIRTLVVDRSDGSAVYGVGSGITWPSEAAAEHAELEVKMRVLDRLDRQDGLDRRDRPGHDATRAPDPSRDSTQFALLETLAVVDGLPRNLEEHLDRLEDSARSFALPCDREQVRDAVRARASQLAAGGRDAVLRLALGMDGQFDLTDRPIPVAGAGPVVLALDDRTQDPGAPAVRHKTTDRAHLVAALARARARAGDLGRDGDARGPAAVDDVVLRGRDGRVTETTIATLLVQIDGSWCTPPVEDGCLAGVGRRLALEAGQVREREITVAELRAASRIALLSSVRGWRPAVLSSPGAAR
ncbi:MAG: aminodeoxychorismate synthase component I [Brachybacterium tyrofermentans]|uniref:Aminodeoxychorismate synthase component I n=1 Tax=Brachybacterium tyrofermentans TaxID=47848 RepID=A0ABW0FC41_9MICO|nr:Para-aminobenzoate synthase, aminase component / Aminodeoxychorismate lyase [Corynebacterium xerosis]